MFLRATGRPLIRLAVVPKVLRRRLAKALDFMPTTIATLRSIYRRRETFYLISDVSQQAHTMSLRSEDGCTDDGGIR